MNTFSPKQIEQINAISDELELVSNDSNEDTISFTYNNIAIEFTGVNGNHNRLEVRFSGDFSNCDYFGNCIHIPQKLDFSPLITTRFYQKNSLLINKIKDQLTTIEAYQDYLKTLIFTQRKAFQELSKTINWLMHKDSSYKVKYSATSISYRVDESTPVHELAKKIKGFIFTKDFREDSKVWSLQIKPLCSGFQYDLYTSASFPHSLITLLLKYREEYGNDFELSLNTDSEHYLNENNSLEVPTYRIKIVANITSILTHVTLLEHLNFIKN